MMFSAPGILLDSASMLEVLLQILVVVVFFGGGFLLLRWLLPKVRRARHAAWEREGLLDPEDPARDPEMNPDWRRTAAPDDER